jgi:HlyD family secretion protein
MITPKSMIPSKSKSAALRAVAVVFALAALLARTGAQDAGRAPQAEAADDKRWQTVAPGRVEPSSGAIKIAAPVMDVIAQVLVKVNDKVFAGEPLIRLTDNEARARLAAAEAQVAFRLRARNDETAPPRRTARRRAKDAVADASVFWRTRKSGSGSRASGKLIRTTRWLITMRWNFPTDRWY